MHCILARFIQIHRLSESLILVVEVSVQLDATSLTFLLPKFFEHLYFDARICNYTDVNRYLFSSERESLQR